MYTQQLHLQDENEKLSQLIIPKLQRVFHISITQPLFTLGLGHLGVKCPVILIFIRPYILRLLSLGTIEHSLIYFAVELSDSSNSSLSYFLTFLSLFIVYNSTITNEEMRIPQGTTLGHCLFIMYINIRSKFASNASAQIQTTLLNIVHLQY